MRRDNTVASPEDGRGPVRAGRPIPSADSLSVRPCSTFTIEHPSNATPEVLTMSDLVELEPLGHPHRVVVGVREDAAQ